MASTGTGEDGPEVPDDDGASAAAAFREFMASSGASDAAASLADPNSAWLSSEDLADVRRRLPILYVEAVPVRLDGMGVVTQVGILLRANERGAITRTLVSGRVMFGETLRDALFRHLEKDLGPMAFPQLPPSPVPFSVAEYFPIPGLSAYLDERQHAVSLAYVVPVTGTCDPRQDALELTWMSPAEASSPAVHAEMEGGRGTLLRAALASVGVLG